jgi:hypothetical protein
MVAWAFYLGGFSLRFHKLEFLVRLVQHERLPYIFSFSSLFVVGGGLGHYFLELLIHIGDDVTAAVVVAAIFLVDLACLLSIGRLAEMEEETGGATSLPSTFLSSFRVSRVSFHYSQVRVFVKQCIY